MATLQDLKNISANLPIQAQKRKAQINQAGQQQVINQIAATNPGQISSGQANQFTQQAAAGIGGQQVQQQAQVNQIGQNIVQQSQAIQGLNNQANMFSLDQKNNEDLQDQKQKLSNLGLSIDRTIANDRNHFNLIQGNQSFLNQRNLIDYAIKGQKRAEDFADYEQLVQHTTQRKMQMMEQVYKQLSQKAEQGFKTGNQKLDNELARELAELKAAYERKIAREAANASNTRGMFTAAGTIAGAVVGSPGGPAGIMAGAAIGGAAGGAAGGAVANSNS